MEIIRSVQNPLVKEIKKLQQKKYREEKGRFLVEGVRLVEEGLKYGRLEGICYEASLLKTARGCALLHMIEQSAGKKEIAFCCQVSADIFKVIAETETPQGIVAVAIKEAASLASLMRKEQGLLLVVDGVQDPGNLGTLVRTAWAAGAQAVVCLPGTVDPYSGKTVRSTMGGIFRIPVISGIDWEALRAWCRGNEYYLVAGDPTAEEEYFTIVYPEKVALIIGNEGQGLLNVKPEQVDYRVKIPLWNGVDSLNAAVSGGVLLYEIIRQKLVTLPGDMV